MTRPTEEEREDPRVNETSSSGRARLSDVRFQEVTYAPTAECRGRWELDERDDTPLQVEACAWRRVPEPFGIDPKDFKRDARWHAAACPGHEVVVERRTVATYWADPPAPVSTPETRTNDA